MSSEQLYIMCSCLIYGAVHLSASVQLEQPVLNYLVTFISDITQSDRQQKNLWMVALIIPDIMFQVY